jgi:hypothetical protein
MDKLTPNERKAILQQIAELRAHMEDERLKPDSLTIAHWIELYDELETLEQLLVDD